MATSSANLVSCAGCLRTFTRQGYSSHIRQTKQRSCIAIREHEEALPGLGHSNPYNEDTAPILFEGDFFGTYTAQEFEDEDGDGGEDDEDNGQEGEGEDDEDDNDADEPEEQGWEPQAPPADSHPVPGSDTNMDDGDVLPQPRDARQQAENQRGGKTFVIPFPGGRAGAPISHTKQAPAYDTYRSAVDRQNTNPWAPFVSQLDWEVARWAKTRGPGSTSVTDLFSIEGVATLLGLSYKNSKELNRIVDHRLPSARPKFKRQEIVVAGEAFDVYFRDILECIKALYSDPEFAPYLLLVPERHYTDATKTTQVFFEMNTGKWWWATQTEVEKKHPGATIIPIIISSDKTQLTQFGNKTAYPVYMTIGNLPKDLRCKPSRRSQVLLAYLPTSRLLHITNKAARRRTLANLFHACMRRIVAPLKTAGEEGIQLASGDGVLRRGHPILAAYVGDYPEQLLVTCCKSGDCPKCPIDRLDVGDSYEPRELRNLANVLEALDQFDVGPAAFTKACAAAGIKPVFHPFWDDLPYVNIFLSITPDILHQMYQGVIKHLMAWLADAYGPEELDARCRRFPPNHNVRLFKKGVTTLSRVTGKEHGDMCRIVLGLIIGLPLRNGFSPLRLVRAVRAILDFLYLAQYPTHTSNTLRLLDDALQRFHANKTIFVDLGIRAHFRLPKLHSLEHYVASIQLFGTTDNYDTQYSERLHIDFAKDAYRATNHKDEFPQMTLWLERKEKIQRHNAFVQWRLTEPTPAVIKPLIQMTRNPSVKAVPFADIATKYEAPYFRDALARFVVRYHDPSLGPAAAEAASAGVYFRFNKIPTYHKIKYWLDDVQGFGTGGQAADVVHARPARIDTQGRPIPARFDTVLVNDGTGGKLGVEGYRVGRVRVVFKLPQAQCKVLFPHKPPPSHLAYVEWFTAFTSPDSNTGLYKISRCVRAGDGARLASIIEIRNIRRSCHLYPDFGPSVPCDWTSSTILDRSPAFWLSPFSDRNAYMTVF